jgi:YolD-like protein
MMLPEHLEQLRDWMREDEYEEKPTIDEWAAQEIQRQLESAYQTGCIIRVKTWEDGMFVDRGGILKTVEERLKLFI